ncbi:Sec1 family protein [Protomyces lactucae-debilis]|uniref:Sec1 family protein n=1 Tax=Protomyces lactucae-debilis TaxID=2754530 RepID=A0A1Y2FW34_PROLT|nr:Sec1 family protein [Protomyces lactucae-debilis]ORY86885.1 Sec1 family protein [Protomyces lactucae-debilis]
MDVVAAAQSYVGKLLAQPGIKVLLLDEETTRILSLISTQSALLEHEVYLTDRLRNPSRERMKHLACIVLCRPTSLNVSALANELADPRYGSYYITFTNILSKTFLEQLAEADKLERVKGVYEHYLDYSAINADFYTLSTQPQAATTRIYGDAPQTWNDEALMRCTEGLAAVLLSLKKKPTIRYARNSPLAKQLAMQMDQLAEREEKLFEFSRNDTPPILLLLDRKNDPVTPLLTQWTYQAMVHDHLGIRNGRVSLAHVDGIRPELKEIVLTTEGDPFYMSNMFLNFGDLGSAVKEYVETYQTRTNTNKKLDSLADMKKFIEDYPEFRKLSGNVSKHVALMSELSKSVGENNLLDVSELEQSLATADNHTADLKQLQRLLMLPSVPAVNKLRLVLLYALRYEQHAQNATGPLQGMLKEAGLSQEVDAVDLLLGTAGASQRQEPLYASGDLFSKARSGIKGLQGIENVYTQHRPLLESQLLNLSKGKLSSHDYPGLSSLSRDKPQDVIVCMIGGATYAEAKVVRDLNTQVPGCRFVLGGTTIPSASDFVSGLLQDGASWSGAGRASAKGRLASRRP